MWGCFLGDGPLCSPVFTRTVVLLCTFSGVPFQFSGVNISWIWAASNVKFAGGPRNSNLVYRQLRVCKAPNPKLRQPKLSEFSFWGTLNIRCRIIIRIQKGTIILTTTHVPEFLNVFQPYGPKRLESSTPPLVGLGV